MSWPSSLVLDYQLYDNKYFSSLQSIFQVNGSYSLSPLSRLHQACKVRMNDVLFSKFVMANFHIP
jgi:hypothetical protein